MKENVGLVSEAYIWEMACGSMEYLERLAYEKKS